MHQFLETSHFQVLLALVSSITLHQMTAVLNISLFGFLEQMQMNKDDNQDRNYLLEELTACIHHVFPG